MSWLIMTKTGKYMRACFEGTKKQARKYAEDHYIHGSYKIVKGRCIFKKRR